MLSHKRICLVIPSLNPGGMERVMSELANYFCKDQNIEVHLLLYGRKHEVFFTLNKKIIIHKPNFTFKNRLRLLYTIKTILFLRNQIKNIDAFAYLSFGERWNNLVLLSSMGLKKKIIVSDRVAPGKKYKFPYMILRKWLYPKANKIIVQTSKAKEIVAKQLNASNIIVIGNPIRKFPHENPLLKENVVLSVGRLITTKHHDDLIRIFVNIKKSGWKLVIVGDDAQKQNNKNKLKELIKSLDAEDIVELVGFTKNVDYQYQKSKIFAFTSSSEGFPNVIGEALSAGLPVVAYNCVAGPSDLIKNGENGYLIEQFNQTIFSQQLFNLMENEELRIKLSNNACNSIQHFNSETICQLYLKELIS